ncbi:succinate-semialdehyde dehydrogenase (NADP(+)), partial [candidate division KSB3 bacterium]
MRKYTQEELLATKACLNGKWVDSRDRKTFPVLDPATGKEIAQCADIGPEQVAEGILGARKAFDSWKKTTAKERSQILRRWHELQIAHQEELAQLMSMEQGRPITEAR